MTVKSEEVDYIAKLARLQFNQRGKEKIIDDLDNILKFVNNLSNINTEDVPITIGVCKKYNVLRDDDVRPSLSREQLLENAPDAKNGYVKVPKVVG